MKYSLLSALWLICLCFAHTAMGQAGTIQLTFEVVQPACSGFTDGMAKVLPGGGTEPYTYAWANGQAGQTNFGLGAGTYAVTVTDQNGKTATGSAVLSNPVPLQAAIAPSGAGCGAAASLNAVGSGGTGPYTFKWSNGAATATIDATTPGSYIVTATDAKGCISVAQYGVAATLVTEVQVTQIPCANLPNGGAVNAITAGGTAPYTYKWSTGGTDPSQQAVQKGTYTVTTTDARGCTTVASGTVTQPTPIEVEVVNITGSCGPNSGSATVKASGGTPPYRYVWNSGAATGPTWSGLAPGQYYVCTFDANNCQHDTWIQIPDAGTLDVKLIVSKAECPGVNDGSATAVVTPPTGSYTYQWNVQNSPPVAQLNGLAPGTQVSVTVTDAVTGCKGTASGVIMTHNVVNLEVTDTDANCPGEKTGTAKAIAAGGTAPYSYVWNLPGNTVATGADISGLAPGAYSVIATDARGCTALNVADIGVKSGVKADYSLEVLECKGDKIVVRVKDKSTGGTGVLNSWTWKIATGSGILTFDQQNPPTFELPGDETGTVQLSVTSAGGCSDAVSQTFALPPALKVSAEALNSAIPCSNEPVPIKVTGSDAYTYNWLNPAGLTFTDPKNVTANPTVTTTYRLAVSNGGCKDTLEVVVTRNTKIDLTVAAKTVTSCEPEATLSATASANAQLRWLDDKGVVIGTGSSIKVKPGATTIYSVVATAGANCSATETVSVSGGAPDVKLDVDAAAKGCEATPLQLKAVNQNPADVLTYQWTSATPGVAIAPANAPNVSISAPAGNAVIKLRAENQFKCVKEIDVPINFEKSESLDGMIETGLCNGKIVKFTNNSTVTGEWFFGDGASSKEKNPSHTYANAGSYTVTFKAQSGCFKPFEHKIQVASEKLLKAAIGNNLEQCTDQATFKFNDLSTVNGATVTGWEWSFSNGKTSAEQNPSISFDTEGMVTARLIVKGSLGCVDTATAQVQVSILKESVSEKLSFCPGSTVALNPDFNQNYQYEWKAEPADPSLNIKTPNPVVSPTQKTVYSVVVSNGACKKEYKAEVAPGKTLSLELPADRLVCNNAPVSLTAQSETGTVITWSKFASFNPVMYIGATASIVPEKNTMYYVRAEKAGECPGVDSIRINNGAVDVAAEPLNRKICNGDDTELTITNMDVQDNLSYAWNNNLPAIQNPKVKPSTTTDYRVVVSNQLGCKDTLDFKVGVVSVDVRAEVLGKTTVCPGETTQLNAIATGGTSYTYSWTPASSLSGSDTKDPIAQPEENTTYLVTVKADGLCTDTASVRVAFISQQCEEPYIFVPKAFTPNGDANNDNFIVRGVNIKELYFVVWDRWGEKVFETSDPQSKGWDGTFNGKDGTPDSYAWYVRATCGNGSVYVKKGDVTLLK
jgi:gliding motility-associated-like protein